MSILNYFKTTSIEEVTGINTNVSSAMFEHIRLWNDMMRGQAPWNNKAPSSGVLSQIATRLNMLVVREIGLEVEGKAIKEVMGHLNSNLSTLVDHITLTGSSLVRPIFSNNKLQYELLPLGNYLPVSYDFDGTLTSALILSDIQEGKKSFLLVEKHDFDGRTHSVESTLYTNDNGSLKRIALTACEQTKNITPFYSWQDVKQPMIIEYRNQAYNKIDGSKLPTAIIAGAENLIEDADKQYERMNWEQEGGELKVFADRDYFRRRVNKDGSTVQAPLSKELGRLIVQIDGDGDSKKITEHSPQLRTTQQNEMLQQIYRRIETTCGLGKGAISDLESVQMTATQYQGGRQDLYALVDRIEDEIDYKYQKTAEVFAHMASAYGLGKYDPKITVTWNDDTTRKDIIQAKQISLQEVGAGVKNKWEHREDFYGEDEAKAKANVPEVPIATNPFGF